MQRKGTSEHTSPTAAAQLEDGWEGGKPASAEEAARPRRVRTRAALARNSGAIKALNDSMAWAIAFGFAMLVRYDFVLTHSGVGWRRFVLIVAFAACIHAALGGICGLYRNHWRFGTLDEMSALAQTTAGTTAVVFTVNVLMRSSIVPIAAPLGAGAAALLCMMASRYGWRIFDQRRRRPSGVDARRVVVFGAGDGAVQLLISMLRNPNSSYVPVALIDDDPRKRNLHIMGVRVFGSRLAIGNAARECHADTLIIAIPSAESEVIRDITHIAEECHLEVRVLPPTDELFDGRASTSDLRTPTIADLLGRRQVQTDLESISHYLTGRRVLVTGAGGSIGSELCRQLHGFGPSELMMLDRDESALHAVQLSLDGRGLLDSPNLILADIRDAAQLERIFMDRRPEVVFHAAALKHLSLLEMHPSEAVKSNVWGTYNVLRAAQRAGVDRFVNISTDKAANPCSVLGYSKRIAERLTAAVAAKAPGGTYLSVRFGNVLGSRGSMLGAFTAQIEAGGPVSVTHREVSRYFMTVEEAVQLVVQAGAVGGAGEALVLDMGEPVRIAEVAHRMIEESGRDIGIVYTGLRPGEKLHEELFGDGEDGSSPEHPLITHVRVPPLHPDEALALPTGRPREEVIAALREAATVDVDLRVVDLLDETVGSPGRS